MKKRMILLFLAALLLLPACGGGQPQTEPTPSAVPTPQVTPVPEKVLVIYFSRTGEMPNVGVIEKGNTAIVAEMIAEKLSGELYEIVPAEENRYPEAYDKLYETALEEQQNKARPPIGGALPELGGYDTVFIGAPVWHGDWPMILYTFFEGVDLSGVRVVPFCTSQGTGVGQLRKNLALACPYTQVEPGLAIRGERCQNAPEEVEDTVDRFLNDLGILDSTK